MQRVFGILGLFGVLMLGPAAMAADDNGFKPIFDGKSLDGWDGNMKLWRVVDGVIVGETTADNPTAGNTFLIWRGGKPANFELKADRVEYWVGKGAQLSDTVNSFMRKLRKAAARAAKAAPAPAEPTAPAAQA